MTAADLRQVIAIAAEVHPSSPEEAAVFAERLRLYPAGCHVFDSAGLVAGYALSHPWCFREPPPLNSVLGELPARPSTYYIHDVALMPACRGGGAGSAIVEILVAQARGAGFANLSLVALPEPAEFWRRHGFRVIESADADAALTERLRSYGRAARFMARDLALA